MRDGNDQDLPPTAVGAPTGAGSAAGAEERADPGFFSRLPGPTRFIIARHGLSEGNARRIVQGRLDFPLDATGREQARALGRWLAGEGLDLILSSPLLRAAETAAIVAAETGGPAPESSALLAELDTGIFTGLSLAEAALRFPAATAEFRRRSWDGVPGTESSTALYARAMEAWRLLRDRASAALPEGRGGAAPRSILALSHGGFIQWLVRATFGCRDWMPLLTTGNCGVFELLAEPAGGGGPASLLWRRIDGSAPDAPAGVGPVF